MSEVRLTVGISKNNFYEQLILRTGLCENYKLVLVVWREALEF
jgi:hypothetical protein